MLVALSYWMVWLQQRVVPSYGLTLLLNCYAIFSQCLAPNCLESELVGPALEAKRGLNLTIKRFEMQSNTRNGLVGMSHAKQ